MRIDRNGLQLTIPAPNIAAITMSPVTRQQLTELMSHTGLVMKNGEKFPLRVRSLVGLIPIFAVEVIDAKLLEKMPKDGRVIELEGIPGTSAALERGAGFHDALKAFPKTKVVAREVADFERHQAQVVIQRILSKNIPFDGVFAHNDNMILGAADALEASPTPADKVLIGFDGIQAAIEALKQGRIDATIAQHDSTRPLPGDRACD